MPYHWKEDGGGRTRLELWPHRSLPKRGFVLFIGATIGFLALPLFAVRGSVILWALLPFIALVIGAMWWALAHSYRTGEVLEILIITPELTRLSRKSLRDSDARHWEANTHWVRPEIIAHGGPVADYLVLYGGPRVVELGAFLTASERTAICTELARHLMQARRSPVGYDPDSGIQ